MLSRQSCVCHLQNNELGGKVEVGQLKPVEDDEQNTIGGDRVRVPEHSWLNYWEK